jgi:hypothetical protein
VRRSIANADLSLCARFDVTDFAFAAPVNAFHGAAVDTGS